MLALVLSGCATGEKAYRGTDEKNFRIQVKALDSSFTNLRATYLYVYDVDARCELRYLGYVSLDEPSMEIGLPESKTLLLTAEFVSAKRFGQSTQRNSYSYLIRTRPSYHYAAEVEHRADSYRFVLRRGRMGSTPQRVVERAGLEDCARSN